MSLPRFSASVCPPWSPLAANSLDRSASNEASSSPSPTAHFNAEAASSALPDLRATSAVQPHATELSASIPIASERAYGTDRWVDRRSAQGTNQ